MKKIKICDRAARKLFEQLTHGIEAIRPWNEAGEYIKDLYRHEAARLKKLGK